ncbi:MAG: outer membrane lipoprotein-sorting protein [Desulfobacterales bacterium]|jgi:outer membrane lipoprotein-sorting protein
MRFKLLSIIGLSCFWSLSLIRPAWALDADSIVKAGFDYWRGKASIATVQMLIHRQDWQRTMTLKAWTRGQKESLFYITAPPKDYGNGTLKKGREMWLFNPKINRVIKVPPSMMSQSWMGSDFSNNDLAKSDSLLLDYDHSIIDTETHEGKKVYVIKSIPRPNAPVVWGMQRLKIREDQIWLSEEFFDEDLKPVKMMTAMEIQMLGGRLFPKVWRMRNVDEENRYTQLSYESLEFKSSLPDRLFTLSNLKQLRR